MQYVLLLFTFIALTGCYRFPEDDEYSIVPATNNPAVTKEKTQGMMPGYKL